MLLTTQWQQTIQLIIFLEEILGIGDTHAKTSDQGPFVVQANFSYLNEMVYEQEFFCSMLTN